MNDCIFCKIIKREAPADIIYEDEEFIGFLNINSIHLGQSLLAPKKHYENLYELQDNTLGKMAVLLKKISIIVKKTVGADWINLIMNVEEAAGQIVPHAHFHIIPRFLNDGYKHWTAKSFPKEEFAEMAEKIRRFL